MPLPVSPPQHEPLGTILGSRAKVSLLRVLTARSAPISQRELARRAGVALRSAQAALADLDAMGIVKKYEGGRDHLTLLNETHILAQGLIALFREESELPRNVRRELVMLASGEKKPPLGMYLFGSVARAEETVDSDLDVLLVARDAGHRDLLLERVLSGVAALRSGYGTVVRPLAYTFDEATLGLRRRAAPWPDIARDAVSIIGPALSELLT